MQYSVPPDLDVRESTMLSTSNRSSSSNEQLDDTCIGMADTVIAYVVMAYMAIAYVFKAYIVMANTGMAYIVMAADLF